MDSTKLVKLIRKVVREEVRKAVKPAINEVLAEQFIRVLGEQRAPGKSLSSIVTKTESISEDLGQNQQLQRRKEMEKKRLQEKIQQISGGDPMSQMIFESIDDEDRSAIHTPEGPAGAYVDTDDDGVDLSQFGL